METTIETTSYTQNRELSWLRFNERVLQEAQDASVPLLEQLKFVSIFTSNLDEFFMIRVGSLFDLVSIGNHAVDKKSGWTPQEQLNQIYEAVRPLYEKRDNVYREVETQLRLRGIYDLEIKGLTPDELEYVKTYFKNIVLPILSPQIVDTNHPFPHLQNKTIHIGALLKHKAKEVFGVIPIPGALPDVLFLPGSEVRYVRMEELLMNHVDKIFSMYTVLEKTPFCITRNADISPSDDDFEDSGDFRTIMRKLLHQRKRLAIVRLELAQDISFNFRDYLSEKFQIRAAQIFSSRSPLNLRYVDSLEARIPDATLPLLTYPPFTPQPCRDLSLSESILKQVSRQDVFLSYPYESIEPFLQMIREASRDPAVVSIKITIYRLARKAKLVEYLCAAAENGKDVTVLIELRARFDEQNNIDWSERLEEAGCKLIYGFEEYKVHSKICLITRKEKNSVKYITQVGTGNYNEKTAKAYTDISLITANHEIGADATAFFKNMAIGNLDASYQCLLIAPGGLKVSILALIDEEIRKGEYGRILIKINSLTDIAIIQKLQKASRAGVTVTLIVRGICCILPGVKGRTENITVISVVDRFLEHSRIYCFGKGSNEKIYLSSADFMTRNMERRVEIACPVYDEAVKGRIHRILDANLCDNQKARIMQPDGSYRKKPATDQQINGQQILIQDAELLGQRTAKKPSLPSRFLRFLKARFQR